jgi:hypothetical protein
MSDATQVMLTKPHIYIYIITAYVFIERERKREREIEGGREGGRKGAREEGGVQREGLLEIPVHLYMHTYIHTFCMHVCLYTHTPLLAKSYSSHYRPMGLDQSHRPAHPCTCN